MHQVTKSTINQMATHLASRSALSRVARSVSVCSSLLVRSPEQAGVLALELAVLPLRLGVGPHQDVVAPRQRGVGAPVGVGDVGLCDLFVDI